MCDSSLNSQASVKVIQNLMGVVSKLLLVIICKHADNITFGNSVQYLLKIIECK
jgi:hypothetical protein